MQIKVTFDRAAAERMGYTLEDVCRAVKCLFAVHDLPCVSFGDVLAFSDKGHGDDFACMWDVILSLLRADWFVGCASACIWQDENGEEDILAQAGKARDTACL